MKEEKQRRFLLITYEFTFSPFSGNGILARSLVKALLLQGHQVTVWCCQPSFTDTADAANQNGISKDNPLQEPEIPFEAQNRLVVIATRLQCQDGWKRLDRSSAWQSFIFSSLESSEQQILLDLISSNNDDNKVIQCAIDWTGAYAHESLLVAAATKSSAGHIAQSSLDVYLNFRIYSSGLVSNDDNKDELDWYNTMECRALERASTVIALSERDCQMLQQLSAAGKKDKTSNNKKSHYHVLFPPLRNEMFELAQVSQLQQHLPDSVEKCIKSFQGENNSNPRRIFLSCVVRQSREKNVLRFVRLVRALLVRLQQQQQRDDDFIIIPLLAGAVADAEYASHVQDELRRVVHQYGNDNVVIVNEFLSAEALAALFDVSLLNVHPCLYDAYGMTIVEAASRGIPSLVLAATNDSVGAMGLLQTTTTNNDDAALLVTHQENNDAGSSSNDDDEEEEYWSKILFETLQNKDKLRRLGQAARERALAWNEEAYGKRFVEIATTAISQDIKNKEQEQI